MYHIFCIPILQVGQHPPEVGRDPHWDIGIPEELPYTVASLPFRIPSLETAAENLKVPKDQHRIVSPDEIEEHDRQNSTVSNQ